MLIRQQASLSVTLIVLFSFVGQVFGQQAPTKNPSQKQPLVPSEDEVVRITTNLVQVDAVVTDKNRKQVTNLRAEDFEILEDGKPQKITNFSYISLGSSPATPEGRDAANLSPKNAPPAPPRKLRADEARRTMVLMVDDLGLDFESTVLVRDALKKFVAEKMEPEDLVAIIRSGNNAGVLQHLTTDRQELYEAINRIRFSFSSREGIDSVTAMAQYVLPQATLADNTPIKEQRSVINDDVFAEFRNRETTTATFAALNLVIRGLGKLPGRKSVVLFSNGLDFSLETTGGTDPKIIEGSQLLIDRANRASVVIYTVDPRPLQAPFDIRDNFAGLSPEQIAGEFQRRRTRTFFQQADLRNLADKTGGFFIGNTNDIERGLRRVAADLEGYYLIGYRPAESTFDRKTGQRRFRTLKVKVKPQELTVRSRTGFFSVPDKKDAPIQGDSLAEALISPFEGGTLRLRLTSLFSRAPQTGTFMRSLIHVDARDLTFVEEPDGRRKTVFAVAGATFDGNGLLADKIDQTFYTMRVSEKTYLRLLQTGFVYTVDFPIKNPGAYQLRFSIRDSVTQRVGSAGHYVLIPNLARERIALSGVIIRGRSPGVAGSAKSDPVAPSTEQNTTAGRVDEHDLESDLQSSPAVRRFRSGTTIDYAYIVYNARTTTASLRPHLIAQVHLFREGKLIYSGKETQIETAKQEDLKRVSILGELQLGNTAAVGEYMLQIVVKDMLAPEKQRLATQWIDFEIVN